MLNKLLNRLTVRLLWLEYRVAEKTHRLICEVCATGGPSCAHWRMEAKRYEQKIAGLTTSGQNR